MVNKSNILVGNQIVAEADWREMKPHIMGSLLAAVYD